MQLPSRRKRVSLVTVADLRGRVFTWADRIADALAAGSVRQRWQELQRRIGITRSGQVALIAALIPWIVARVVAGTALYIFAYGIVLLIGASYGLTPRRLKLEGVRVGLFPRAQEGDRLEAEVQLTAKRGISTFVLEERLPERLGTSVKVPIPKLAREHTVTHRYSVRCSRRGVYEIGPLVAVTSDPLGLTQKETVIAEKFELLVHPRIRDVSDRPLTRQFEDPPIRPPISRPWPSGLEFYGMREYVPGDDLRRIVWRASARAGKLMVREAEQGIADHVTVMLDTDRGTHSWDGDHSESFETGVRAAASLAVKHLREGYEIRCEANAGQLLRPVRGAMQQMALLDGFARVQLDREPLSKMIMRLVADPRRNAHNILVTPRLGQVEAAQLRILLNKGVSVLVVALLWEEEHTETLGIAAALGCQVAAVHPEQDLAAALYHDIGAGNR